MREMELLGTTLYFAKVAENESEIPRLVQMVKPHFEPEEIKGALKNIKERGFLSPSFPFK